MEVCLGTWTLSDWHLMGFALRSGVGMWNANAPSFEGCGVSITSGRVHGSPHAVSYSNRNHAGASSKRTWDYGRERQSRAPAGNMSPGTSRRRRLRGVSQQMPPRSSRHGNGGIMRRVAGDRARCGTHRCTHPSRGPWHSTYSYPIRKTWSLRPIEGLTHGTDRCTATFASG